jgi:hypothetical protein
MTVTPSTSPAVVEVAQAVAASTPAPTPEQIAGKVSTVDEQVLKLMPFISTVIAFIPGAQVAAPFMPLVAELLAVVDNAAKAVATGSPGAAFQDVIDEVMSHLTPGAPNSPILSADAAPPVA